MSSVLNISRQIYTDISYEIKNAANLFSLSVCINMTQDEFTSRFCKSKFSQTECIGFNVVIEEDNERVEKDTNTFYEKIQKEEIKKELTKVFYNYSKMFCVKYESKTAVKNDFFYSVRPLY